MPATSCNPIALIPARLLLIAALFVLVVPQVGRGQTVPVEPYYAVVTDDDVPLKAGGMDSYYHITLLERGRVLRVSAEGGGWAQVSYPTDLPVYVRAEEVDADSGGRFVTLTRQSGLKSVHQGGGFGKSWQRAMPRGQDAPIGTRLRVFDAIQDVSDTTIGYAVAPPAGARAFVKAGFLRAATEAEVEAYLMTLPEATESETPSEADDGEPQAPSGQDTPAADENTDDETQAGNDDADISLIDVPEEPADQPGAETETAEDQPDDDNAVTRIDQGQADDRARLIGTLTQLSELFAQVQRQDSDTAELDEMAAELRRAIAAQGDDAIGQRVATSLGQRLQLIEMRITARDSRRELRTRRESIDASYSEIASRIRELETTRGYQFVGRLVASSVYDGDRLPLMYRIVSINESVPRTIGYIAPGADTLGVSDKLGEIVGVLGTSTLDRDLNLRIVTPTRVDTLAPERVGVTGAGADRSGS